jgi:hypothetical protein
MKQYRVTGELCLNPLGGAGVNIGNPTGMFHLMLGHDHDVIIGNGKNKLSTVIPQVFSIAFLQSSLYLLCITSRRFGWY